MVIYTRILSHNIKTSQNIKNEIFVFITQSTTSVQAVPTNAWSKKSNLTGSWTHDFKSYYHKDSKYCIL